MATKATIGVHSAGPLIEWNALGWPTRVTDSTNLSCTNSGNKTNIGSPVNLTIPASNGLILAMPLSYRVKYISGSGYWFYPALGVTVDGTDYTFEHLTGQGTGMGSVGPWSGSNGGYRDVYAVIGRGARTTPTDTGLMAIDVDGLGISTGLQSVQLYFTNTDTDFTGTAQLQGATRETVIGIETATYGV